jgi:hypothetical protein
VVKRTKDGQFVGVVSGMGENAGTWDSNHGLEDARRFAAELQNDDPEHDYVVEDLGGPVEEDEPTPTFGPR